jgi:hypothetical protein
MPDVRVKSTFEAVGTENIETKIGVKADKEYVYNVTGTVNCCLYSMQMNMAARRQASEAIFNTVNQFSF